VIRRSCAAATAIIAVSKSTAADLRELLRVPESKIHVIYEAADERFRPAKMPDDEQLQAIHPALTKSYILTVGTIEPRKRIGLLVEAYEKMRNRSSLSHSLIIVGKVGWKAGPSLRAMRESSVADSIFQLDYIAEHDLIDIYHGADLFVSASRYEGFGLPPLEAMACGVPVVVTAGGSSAEMVGGAGMVVKESTADALANAMITLLIDEELYAALRQKGLERDTSLTWKDAAKKTLAVYEKVTGSAPPA
jgi:glycosyltransferase involved in cell wall biosynthesis